MVLSDVTKSVPKYPKKETYTNNQNTELHCSEEGVDVRQIGYHCLVVGGIIGLERIVLNDVFDSMLYNQSNFLHVLVCPQIF